MILHNGSQLLNIHLCSPITHHCNNRPAGFRIGCSYRSGKTEPHSSQPSTCHIGSGMFEVRVAACCHLMLSYVCHNYSFTLRHFIQITDHFSHGNLTFIGIKLCMNQVGIFHFMAFFKSFMPGMMFSFYNPFRKKGKSMFAVTKNRDINFYVFIDLCFINIQMNNFCLFCILIQSSCYTVVETHSYSNQNITFVG